MSADYALPENVVAIRLYNEPGVGSGGDWAIDGVDAEGKYTESCWTFATEQEAIEAIPEFCVGNGICDGPAALALPVRPHIDRSENEK